MKMIQTEQSPVPVSGQPLGNHGGICHILKGFYQVIQIRISVLHSLDGFDKMDAFLLTIQKGKLCMSGVFFETTKCRAPCNPT